MAELDKLYAQKCDAVRRWNTRKTGEIATDANVPSNDCISRQAALDALDEIESEVADGYGYQYEKWRKYFCGLPSAQPEIIRCKDCAKHEYCRTSTVWAIPPKDDWYCADAERRTDG